MHGDVRGSDVARLLDTFNGLVRARDEADVLSAMATSVEHLAPAAIVLVYVHTADDGAVVETEVVGIWAMGRLVAQHAYYGLRMPAGSHPWTAVALTEPLVVADVAENLDLAAHTAALGLPTRSFVGLPLYSPRQERCQGVVELHWYTQYAPDTADLLYLRALALIAGEMIAGDRTLRAHRQALALQHALHARAEWVLREAGRLRRSAEGQAAVRVDGAGGAGEAQVKIADGVLPPEMSLKTFRESVERAFILKRLDEHGWNVSRTAEALNIERSHLHKKLKLLCIERPGGVHDG